MSIDPTIIKANILLDLLEQETFENLMEIRYDKPSLIAQNILKSTSITEDQLWSQAADLLLEDIKIIKSEKSPKVKVIEALIREMLSPGEYNLMDIFSRFKRDFVNKDLITDVSSKLSDIISWLPRSKIKDLGNQNIQQFFGSTAFGCLESDEEALLWKCVARRLDVNIVDTITAPREVRRAIADELLKRQPKQDQ